MDKYNLCEHCGRVFTESETDLVLVRERHDDYYTEKRWRGACPYCASTLIESIPNQYYADYGIDIDDDTNEEEEDPDEWD